LTCRADEGDLVVGHTGPVLVHTGPVRARRDLVVVHTDPVGARRDLVAVHTGFEEVHTDPVEVRTGVGQTDPAVHIVLAEDRRVKVRRVLAGVRTDHVGEFRSRVLVVAG